MRGSQPLYMLAISDTKWHRLMILENRIGSFVVASFKNDYLDV